MSSAAKRHDASFRRLMAMEPSSPCSALDQSTHNVARKPCRSTSKAMSALTKAPHRLWLICVVLGLLLAHCCAITWFCLGKLRYRVYRAECLRRGDTL